MASADAVNEGSLNFLAKAPAQPPHHHQNHIHITADSLATGWIELRQCHDHLDPVPRTQITFRTDHVRNLRVDSIEQIESVWVEGPSVQLAGVQRGARLCLSADTRALHARGNGYFVLQNGPYLRRFLDGYYPIRVSLQIDYPPALLKVVGITPPPQPGLAVVERPGTVQLDALFEGRLTTRIQFRRVE